MRILDRTRTAMRSTVRRWAARLPASIGQYVTPSSLALHLSSILPGERNTGSSLPVPDWDLLCRTVVEVVADRGPVPAHVLTVGRAPDAGTLRVIRLAHRLDCPVVVWTDGTGLDGPMAGELLDVGCEAVAVTVASLDDDVHRAVVGNSVVEATDALVALATARANRGASVLLHLALPWSAGVEPEARGVLGWADQVGVDSVTILPPVRGGAVGPLAEWVDVLRDGGVVGMGPAEERYLRALAAEVDDLPGISRSAADLQARIRPCPVVGTRIAIDAAGAVFACPFHPPMGTMKDSALSVWEADTTHREAVRDCTRRCRHPTLALGPGLPGRWRLRL